MELGVGMRVVGVMGMRVGVGVLGLGVVGVGVLGVGVVGVGVVGRCAVGRGEWRGGAVSGVTPLSTLRLRR